MVNLNSDYARVNPVYLFQQVAKRTNEFIAAHPNEQKDISTRVIRLGIGNTTEPLPQVIADSLVAAARGLGTPEGYAAYGGYGDEPGMKELRTAIANSYGLRGTNIDPSEIFVSDGAKSDLGNLMHLFARGSIIAVQDPVYPAYVDTALMSGHDVVKMPCTPENDFFPEFNGKRADVIYFCSPNNPTGVASTNPQLETLVRNARRDKSVIVFDSAYSAFNDDPEFYKSIYEAKGARDAAIEVNSFSKWAGFTGGRLGWTVVPNTLTAGGSFKEGALNAMWKRRQTTFFNGASNIIQLGGLATFTVPGNAACQQVVDYYKRNAEIIRESVNASGLTTFGGVHAPYIWAKLPEGMKSSDAFEIILNKASVVTTPRAGFGDCGEGFLRFSAFGHRENIEEACRRLADLRW